MTLFLPDLNLPPSGSAALLLVTTCVHYNASQIEVNLFLTAKSTVTADLWRKEKSSPGLNFLLTLPPDYFQNDADGLRDFWLYVAMLLGHSISHLKF